MNVILDPGLLARVDALQQAYAHALDRRFSDLHARGKVSSSVLCAF